jgi:hypothetical protein
MERVTVDFIARDPDLSRWQMVLVEQGPWPSDSVNDQLQRLQLRLYECVDAALDGQLAARYPDSASKRLVIRIDGYNLPEQEVRSFFDRFSAGIFETSSYKQALASNSFVSQILFELNLQRLPDDA